jgi:ribonuclease III
MKLKIKLGEAKRAIAIPEFKCNDLLAVALINHADLVPPLFSTDEAERLKRKYRQLAFLGDTLFNSVLADYLTRTNQSVTNSDLHAWKEKIVTRKSFTKFAIELGLPRFSSSWEKKTCKRPEDEPNVWGEMFEAVVAVVYIDGDRDFNKLSSWLVNSFIRDAVGGQI